VLSAQPVTGKRTVPNTSEGFLRIAIEIAMRNVHTHGGRPFGAVIVKGGEVLATGVNETHLAQDPTAHAELQAIRAASAALGSPRLDGCIMYASGHPCPMCLSAMYLTGILEVYYAYSNEDGEPFGLSTAELYAELAKPLFEQAMRIEHRPVGGLGEDLYEVWRRASV
jgi:guanine deaminase